MTDNIQQIRDYMQSFGLISDSIKKKCDYYFDVQIIRRGKDNPDMPAANYQLKVYYMDSFEKFDRFIPEIKTLCDTFKCRAYVSTTIKLKRKLAAKTLSCLAEMIENGDISAPWRLFAHASDKVVPVSRRWVVDIDNVDELPETAVDTFKDIIRSCDSGHEDPVILKLDTRSGIHLITHPFNLAQFEKKTVEAGLEKIADVKKNHITLLYENL